MAKGRYEESSIRVLKGLQPVRERPGMYTRTIDPTHIVAGGDRQRRGRGAWPATPRASTCAFTPITRSASRTTAAASRSGLHPEEKVPTIELVFTRLHAGGKFDKRDGQRRVRVLGRLARRRRLGDQRAVPTPRSRGEARRQGASHRLRGRRCRAEAQGRRQRRPRARRARWCAPIPIRSISIRRTCRCRSSNGCCARRRCCCPA